MTTTDIINQICSETGIDFVGKESPDLVTFKDLNVHKTEVWSLTVTDSPESHFLKMDQQYKNKIGYRFKFQVPNLNHGLELCRGLSKDFGINELDITAAQTVESQNALYLAVHIHPEFVFTPKNKTTAVSTQELKMCFI